MTLRISSVHCIKVSEIGSFINQLFEIYLCITLSIKCRYKRMLLSKIAILDPTIPLPETSHSEGTTMMVVNGREFFRQRDDKFKRPIQETCPTASKELVF